MNRYVLNNPLKYTDPSGYQPAPHEPDENGKGGGGGQYNYSHYRRYSFSAANARADGYFGSGGYYYDWTTGTYHENYTGADVSFSTVNNNYILPNSITLKPIQIQRNSIIPELNPNSLTAGDGNFMGLDDRINIQYSENPILDVFRKIKELNNQGNLMNIFQVVVPLLNGDHSAYATASGYIDGNYFKIYQIGYSEGLESKEFYNIDRMYFGINEAKTSLGFWIYNNNNTLLFGIRTNNEGYRLIKTLYNQ